jgi:hypothetical protein
MKVWRRICFAVGGITLTVGAFNHSTLWMVIGAITLVSALAAIVTERP